MKISYVCSEIYSVVNRSSDKYEASLVDFYDAISG